jgi:uncharacterized protein (DUF1501 family)
MKVPRRTFVLGGAGLILSSTQLFALAARSASSKKARPLGSSILVNVHLAGGNDGLNTVVPYGCGQYYSARPNLCLRAPDLLPITGSLGLNPQLAGLHELFQRGCLAIVLGVGYPQASRSHFRSLDIWQTAEPDKILETGWLGRYIDQLDYDRKLEPRKFFPAINVDPMLPKSLAAQLPVPSISDLNQWRFNTDHHYQLGPQRRFETFNKIYRSYNLANLNSQLLNDIGLEAMQISHYLETGSHRYTNSVSYPENGFGRGMKFIAQMIVAGFASRVYNISLGGFDTHTNQGETHPQLLRQFSETMTAFYKDLCFHNADNNVLLMAFSEFGRRLKENQEGGTDHGTAQPVFLMGTAVKGGLYGDHPNLTDLDGGDLKYGIDFRTIYATILDRWLDADAKLILGGRFENLAFI